MTFNISFNWFSNNNTIKQQNSISTLDNDEDAKLKSDMKSIDDNYFIGEITQAFEGIDKAMSEASKKEVKYPLLLKKVEFLLETRDIEKVKLVLALLEKDYIEYIDLKYKEYKLLIYSVEKDEENFLNLLNEIKAEKDDVKSDKYFKILYNSNSDNLEEAERLFNEYTPKEQEKNYLTGGHLFSNLYNKTKDREYLEKAKKFYQMALDYEPRFLMKVHVIGFFVQLTINKVFQTKNNNCDKSQLIKYKVLLKKLFTSKKYFNDEYINQLTSFYAFVLLVLEFKDEYIQHYEDHSKILFNEHCLQYYSFKGVDIEHKQVQKNLNSSDSLLLNYTSLMTDKDEKKTVLSYFESKCNLLFKYDLSILFYIKAVVNFEYEVIKEIELYIDEKKTKSYELYLSYLLLQNYRMEQITDDEINILIEYVNNSKSIYSIVLETIDFLEKIKRSDSYIKFAITKVNEFEDLAVFILLKCWHNRELRLEDFELFVTSIDNIKYAPYIADIYYKYDRYDNAFECFQNMWEHEHNIENAINLLRVGVNNFQKFTSRIDEEIENEALFYLQSMQKELEFNIIGLISYYSLVINKDKNNAFGIINKKVLGLNVYELDNEDKQQLSALYFNSITNFKDKELDTFEKNTIFIKDNIHYLDKDVFKSVNEVYIEKFNIAFVNKWEMKRMEEDKDFERKSLFHFLVNQILETIDSPYFKMMTLDLGSKMPFEEMKEMMIAQSEHTENQFEKYSNSEDISFWNLAGSYDKYFNLIVKLLEDETINFNSCIINYKSKEVPKLLTLSSIVFLNYNNKLESVLEREDVFIQKTTYNWLMIYIEELDKEDEIFSAFAKDGELFKDVVPKERIEVFSSSLKEMLNNIKYKQIVDDTKASLPFKDAFSLSKYFGIQEYQALALSYQKNFQIITEDRMFEVMFDVLKFNKTMIGNSFSLFKDNELHDLRMDLHRKKYKSVIHLNMLIELFDVLTKQRVRRFSKNSADIIKVLNDYGSLEHIKRVYHNHYKVLHPKVVFPEEDDLSRNIETMLECLELKD